MTHNEAKLLDYILQHQKNGIFDVDAATPGDNNDLIAAGEYLENKDFGKYLSKNTLRIFPAGISFAKEQSFYKKLIGQEEDHRKHALLTDTTLKAAKQEPYWKLATIILAIISTILGILVFLSQK